jgi:hypothetical protein
MLCELVSNAFIYFDDAALKKIGELVDDALEHGEPYFREAIKLAVGDASLDVKTLLPLLSGMRQRLALLQSLRDSGCELTCTAETMKDLQICIKTEAKRRIEQCLGYLERHEPIPANVQNYLNTAINWIGNGTTWPEQFWKQILAVLDMINLSQVPENQVSITKAITERYNAIQRMYDDAVQAKAFPDSLTDHYDAWTMVIEALRTRAGKIKKENE